MGSDPVLHGDRRGWKGPPGCTSRPRGWIPQSCPTPTPESAPGTSTSCNHPTRGQHHSPRISECVSCGGWNSSHKLGASTTKPNSSQPWGPDVRGQGVPGLCSLQRLQGRVLPASRSFRGLQVALGWWPPPSRLCLRLPVASALCLRLLFCLLGGHCPWREGRPDPVSDILRFQVDMELGGAYSLQHMCVCFSPKAVMAGTSPQDAPQSPHPGGPGAPATGPSQVSPYRLRAVFLSQGSPELSPVCLLGMHTTHKVSRFGQISASQEPAVLASWALQGRGPSSSQSSTGTELAQVCPGADRAAGPPMGCVVRARCVPGPQRTPRSGQVQPQMPWERAKARGSGLGRGGRECPPGGGSCTPKHVSEPQLVAADTRCPGPLMSHPATLHQCLLDRRFSLHGSHLWTFK